MSNSLHRGISRGEKIVLKAGVLRDEYDTLEWRTVEALEGFGLFAFTVGSKITVRFQDGDIATIDGSFDIDVEETKKLQVVAEKEPPKS